MKTMACLLFFAGFASVHPEVSDTSSYGFTVKGFISIQADSNKVWRHLVKDVGKWWDPDHTFSGRSGNMSLEPEANGCFCEKLGNGGSVRHMEIVFAMPGKMLRMTGGLGPLQSLGVTGSLTFLLYGAENGTAVEMTYGAGGYAPGGLQKWAAPVDLVLNNQLNRLKKFIETGKP